MSPLPEQSVTTTIIPFLSTIGIVPPSSQSVSTTITPTFTSNPLLPGPTQSASTSSHVQPTASIERVTVVISSSNVPVSTVVEEVIVSSGITLATINPAVTSGPSGSVVQTSASSSPTSTSSPPNVAHIPAGLFAGIIIGLVLLVTFMGFGLMFLHDRRRHRFFVQNNGLAPRAPAVSEVPREQSQSQAPPESQSQPPSGGLGIRSLTKPLRGNKEPVVTPVDAPIPYFSLGDTDIRLTRPLMSTASRLSNIASDRRPSATKLSTAVPGSSTTAAAAASLTVDSNSSTGTNSDLNTEITNATANTAGNPNANARASGKTNISSIYIPSPLESNSSNSPHTPRSPRSPKTPRITGRTLAIDNDEVAHLGNGEPSVRRGSESALVKQNEGLRSSISRKPVAGRAADNEL